MSSKIKSTKKNVIIERSISESILLLFPILFIVIVLPLIVKMKSYDPNLASYDWFADQHQAFDFFLYYKQWFFVGLCGLMVIIVTIRAIIDKSTIKFNKTFIPLFLYALLALLSTIFSKYRSFGFTGSFEQFENVFCLIGYALVVYYTYLIIRTEAELKLVINAVAIGALILGIIGTFQAFGMDFFNSQMGRQMIAEKGTDPNSLNMVFEKGRVYTTLYNPNYVGVYTAIMIPLFTTMLFFSRYLKEFILYTLVVITSIISMFGSQSKAGIISIGVAFLIAIVFLRKIILQKKVITIAIISLIGIGFFFINRINDNAYINALLNIFNTETQPNLKLTSINTSDKNIAIEYAGNTMYAEISDAGDLILYDANNALIPYYTAAVQGESNIIQIDDMRFAEIVPVLTSSVGELTFFVEDRQFTFSNQVVAGKYLYYNRYGKFSPIKTVDSGLFTNRESLATKRGFIWGRTIPLIKDYVLLGSGADSFIHVYPQYDYVNYINYNYEAELISKPHNFYLQTSIQTGLISLLSLLVFFGIYIIQCLKLYFNNKFTSISSKIGLSITIAVISYLVSCLSNDSSTSVAPVFWALVGIGLVANLLEKNATQSNHS